MQTKLSKPNGNSIRETPQRFRAPEEGGIPRVGQTRYQCGIAVCRTIWA